MHYLNPKDRRDKLQFENLLNLLTPGAKGTTGFGNMVFSDGPAFTGNTNFTTIILTGNPPVVLTGIALSGVSGFGTGSSGTAVTTTTKGTGGGPTNPQTIVGYIQIVVNGAIAWVPFVR